MLAEKLEKFFAEPRDSKTHSVTDVQEVRPSSDEMSDDSPPLV